MKIFNCRKTKNKILQFLKKVIGFLSRGCGLINMQIDVLGNVVRGHIHKTCYIESETIYLSFLFSSRSV